GRSDNLRRGVLPFEVVGRQPTGLAATAPDIELVGAASFVDETGDLDMGQVMESDAAADTISAATAPNPLVAVAGYLSDVISWERLSEFGQVVGGASTLTVIGALVSLGYVLQGRAEEVSRTVRWIQLAAVGVVLGLMIQGVADAAGPAIAHPGPWHDLTAWSSSVDGFLAFRVIVAMVGALLVVSMDQRAGLHPIVDLRTSAQPSVDVGSGATSGGQALVTMQKAESLKANQWAFDLRATPLPLVGAGLLALAMALDAGARHGQPTATIPLSLLHIAAAGIWFGTGTFTLAVLSRRATLRQRLDAPGLIAAAGTAILTAMAVALVSGAALSSLTHRFGLTDRDAWVTTVKIGAGISAGGLALLNRKVLAPRLDDAETRASPLLRAFLTVEALLLAAGVAATAVEIG
ncbi:MAG: hypothetical protein P8N02_14335, partial [Actinomycetota bacterium]|nr:hypothetical protein [Actinomycetota bacterium]